MTSNPDLMQLTQPLVLMDRKYLVAFPKFPDGVSLVLSEGLRGIGSTDTGPEGIIWRHLSISLPDRDPSWEQIKTARYQFFPEDGEVFQLLPPHSDYVNLHPHVFHLWGRMDDVRMFPNR